MSRAKTVNHNGSNILHMDFSNTKNEDEINTIIEESKNIIRSKPSGSLLAVTNMSNMYFSKAVANNFTAFIKGNKPYMKKSSVYGLSGLASIVFNGIMKITRRDIRSFENEVDAKDFLIES